MARTKKRSTIKKDDGIWEQLLQLKALTLALGTIHEAQKMQLKIWATLALPQADSVDIKVGLPYLDEDNQVVNQHFVEFDAQATRKPPKDLRRRLEGLGRSVSDLLGDVFTLRVRVNETLIFNVKGKRGKQNLKALMKRLQDADAKANRAGPGPS